MSILTICLHQYIGGTGPAAPIGKETLTFRKFKNFTDFLNVSSTNILVQYKENLNVSSTTPIQLNVAYSVSWSEQKRKNNYSKMATNFRDKRTLITTMQAKNQAFAIFPTPLISHYPLPLMTLQISFSFLLVYCPCGPILTSEGGRVAEDDLRQSVLHILDFYRDNATQVGQVIVPTQ
jgi:hypothetical protein